MRWFEIMGRYVQLDKIDRFYVEERDDGFSAVMVNNDNHCQIGPPFTSKTMCRNFIESIIRGHYDISQKE